MRPVTGAQSIGVREARVHDSGSVGRVAVEPDMLDAQAADQRERPCELQPVLERQRLVVDARGLLLGRERAVEAAIGIDQRHGIAGKVRSTRPDEIEIARRQRRNQAVVEAGDVRIPDQVGDIADQPLAVRDIKALAIHQVRGRVERLDLIVEPTALGTIAIGLALQRQVRRQLQLETAAQPHLLGDVAIVENVVIGVGKVRSSIVIAPRSVRLK
ncbi:hypothetical protein ACU4GH_30720 [Bradyrhizobium betae]